MSAYERIFPLVAPTTGLSRLPGLRSGGLVLIDRPLGAYSSTLERMVRLRWWISLRLRGIRVYRMSPWTDNAPAPSIGCRYFAKCFLLEVPPAGAAVPSTAAED